MYLNGNYNVTAIFQEHVRVDGHNTGLIGLGNISEYNVDHADKHAVLMGVTCVLNDGNNVGALFGDIDEITARSVGEFNGVDEAFRANNVGDVGDGCAGRSAQVEYLCAGLDMDVIDTA